jgi:hypothetical protein
MLDDDYCPTDETIDSLETWLDERARATSRGALTCDMVMSAYIEATGLDVDLDEVYSLLSERFTADRSERGELIFRAVLES